MRTQINVFTRKPIRELLDVVTHIRPLDPSVLTRVSMRTAADQIARVTDDGRVAGSFAFMKGKILRSDDPATLPYSGFEGIDEGERVVLFCSSTRAYSVPESCLLD